MPAETHCPLEEVMHAEIEKKPAVVNKDKHNDDGED